MYMWSERVVRNVTRKDWSIHTGSTTKVVNMIVTPRVKVSFTLIAEHFRQHIQIYVLFFSMLSYIYLQGVSTLWCFSCLGSPEGRPGISDVSPLSTKGTNFWILV